MALFETDQHFGLLNCYPGMTGSEAVQIAENETTDALSELVIGDEAEAETGTVEGAIEGNENEPEGTSEGTGVEIIEHYGEPKEEHQWKRPTFKDCVAADIDLAFFNEDEHADWHDVDGKRVLVVIIEEDLREHSSHWEAGAKQNFDTGLYDAHIILYIRIKDYGPKPKIGKHIVLDADTKHKRTFEIVLCREEAGVYRMTLKRIRQ